MCVYVCVHALVRVPSASMFDRGFGRCIVFRKTVDSVRKYATSPPDINTCIPNNNTAFVF